MESPSGQMRIAKDTGKSQPKVLPMSTIRNVTKGPVTPVLTYSRVVYVAVKRIPPPHCDD